MQLIIRDLIYRSPLEHILVKFIHSIVEETTYWDEDVANFINENFWDLI